MTTETINIIVRENGSRVVRRNFDLMGRQALTTNSAVSILSRSLLGLAGGLSLAIGLRTFIRTLADFSQALSTVKAITGASNAEFVSLEAEIKKLGATTRFTATQAAEGAQFLARAGFNAAQTTEALSGTLTLAQAGALSFGAASDIATNILTAFNKKVSETNNVVDILAFAANRSNTNVQQLGDAMKFVAPIASGLNVSLETTAAAIMALSDAGLQGSIAGTGLRRVMTELEVANTGNLRTLERLHLTQEQVRPSVVGLATAIETLSKAGLSAGEAMRFFGQRGGPAFQNLARNIPKLRASEEALSDVTGFSKELARVMDDNLNGAILRIKAAVESFIIVIGDSGAFTILTKVFDSLATAIRFAANNIELFAAALQALLVVKIGQFLLNAISRNNALIASIRAGTVVLENSVAIEYAKANSSLKMAAASTAAAAATVHELRTSVANIAQQRIVLLQQQQSITLDTQRRLARDALTGRFIAYNAAVAQNIATNRALLLTDRTLAATKAQLTVAIGAQTAATVALTGAQGRQALASAATLTTVGRLTSAAPLLAGVIGGVSKAVSWLINIIKMNPLTSLVVGIYTVIQVMNKLAQKSAQSAAELKAATDGAVSIITEQYEAILNLTDAQETNNVVTLESANATLAQAESYGLVAKAAQEAAVAIVAAAVAGLEIQRQMLQDQLRATSQAAHSADMYEAIERQLAEIVVKQQELWRTTEAGNDSLEFMTIEIERMREAIRNARDGLVSFNGDLNTSNEMTERLGLTAGRIKFSDAVKAARELAEQLKVTLQYAMILQGTLHTRPEGIFDPRHPAFDSVENRVNRIATLMGQMSEHTVSFTRELSASARAANDIAAAAGRIQFSDAVMAARELSKELGVSLQRAMQLQGTLRSPQAANFDPRHERFNTEESRLARVAQLMTEVGTSAVRWTGSTEVLAQAISRTGSATDSLADSTETLSEAATLQMSILESILGPQEALSLGQEALNALFSEGSITLEQYNTKLREMQIASDNATNTINGGFRASMAGAIMSAGQLGNAIGDQFVSLIGNASNALVDFAMTGELNLKKLFAEFFANLAKLILNQALLSLFGGIMGIPTTGGGGGGGGLLGGLLGFSTGGSILPSGPGTTDSQIVQFAKRPDERVDILTPAQQAAQQAALAAGSNSTPAPSNNVRILNVLDPALIGQFINTAEGEKVIMNILSKNGIS